MPESDRALEISVQDVHDLIEARKPILLIDVRELGEFSVARIEGSQLIPMRSIPQHVESFQNRAEPLILICHHGVRSLQVAVWLRDHGVVTAQSMAGGIDAWSRLIDPTVPLY